MHAHAGPPEPRVAPAYILPLEGEVYAIRGTNVHTHGTTRTRPFPSNHAHTRVRSLESFADTHTRATRARTHMRTRSHTTPFTNAGTHCRWSRCNDPWWRTPEDVLQHAADAHRSTQCKWGKCKESFKSEKAVRFALTLGTPPARPRPRAWLPDVGCGIACAHDSCARRALDVRHGVAKPRHVRHAWPRAMAVPWPRPPVPPHGCHGCLPGAGTGAVRAHR